MEITEEILKLAQKADLPEGKLTNEFLFTIQAANIFFFNKNIGEQDIRECFTDGANDGGIDFICVKDDNMNLIQGKSTESLTYDDIRNALKKIDETVRKFDNHEYFNYSEKLQRTYLNARDSLDEVNINLVLFTNTKLSEDVRNKIEELKKDISLVNYDIFIFDVDDIDDKLLSLQEGNSFISSGALNLYGKANNSLVYGDNGIIVNISANSLKDMYIMKHKNGLFSYNLREHISQKNVDDGIDNTIKNTKDNFWFYNNGITIGCGDFKLDGNKLKLNDFSIINGAQTTTKIGESKIISPQHDFAVVCKIVKAPKDIDTDRDFIMAISEASNSQKPIKPRDLKANAIEQKKMQEKSASNAYPLAIEIKRGVKPRNYNSSKIQAWQRVSNEYLGQLIMACILQKPGTARSKKVSIFNVTKIYNEVFRQEHDYNVLYDLVRIANQYDEFKIKYIKTSSDMDDIAICNNGKFEVLAIVFYFYKLYSNIINNSTDSELEKYNITNTMLTINYKEDDYEDKLMNLFAYIISKLRGMYDSNKVNLNLTSCSNFFKTDVTYRDVILKSFDKILTVGTFSNYEKETIDKCMSIFGF